MGRATLSILALFCAFVVGAFVQAQSSGGWGDPPRTTIQEFSIDDFQPMSASQAAELAIQKIQEGNRAVGGVAGLNKDECGGPRVSVTRMKPEGAVTESVAICMLEPEELKTHLADHVSPKISWEFSTGNDANPRKLGTRVEGDGQPGQGLNDDVGRTFDIAVSRRKTTEEGYSEVRIDSNNFGQRTTVGGASADASGRPYMKLLNVTSLTLAEGTKLRSADGVTDLRIVEGSVEVSTGKGKSLLGTEMQTWFHETTRSGPVYHYVDHEKTKVVATLKGGLSRVIESDLGAFRCKLTGTGLVGIGTDGKPVLEGRANASINTGSLGGRSAANPWLQLDAYRTHLIKQGDRPEEKYGVRVSTSVEMGPVRVKPFISISRFDGSRDRTYAAGSRGGRGETYYGVGIMAEWK